MGASPGPKLFQSRDRAHEHSLLLSAPFVLHSVPARLQTHAGTTALCRPAGSTLTCTLCSASNTSRGVTLYETCFCQGTPASTHQTLCHAGFSGNGADSSGTWLCHRPPHPDAHVSRSASRVRLRRQHDHG